MSAEGLSRRRVGVTGSSSNGTSPKPDEHDGLNDHLPRNAARSQSESASSPGHHSNTHAGTAFAGGSKIAFDPRDLDQDAVEEARIGGKMPRLTIMEEVLLLGIKDKQGYLSFWNDNISYALRGCILIELALRRRIAIVKDSLRRQTPISDRLIEVIDDRQTGETILDEALKMIKSQEEDKLGINNWIDLLSGKAHINLLSPLASFTSSLPSQLSTVPSLGSMATVNHYWDRSFFFFHLSIIHVHH